MKTRFLSILLAIVMLISMLPLTAFATTEDPAMQVSLTLTDSIAINYYVDASDIVSESFTKVEFYHGDTLLETVTQLPAASDNGMYAFSYKDIDPDMMSYDVTAKLYAGDVNLEATASVSSYCNAILQNSENYAQELCVLAMEILDYGAAAQKYIAAKRDTTVNDADLVNYGIAEAYPEIAALCNQDITYESLLAFDGDVEDCQAVWAYAGLYLQESIILRFGFDADSVDGMTMQVNCGDNQWTVSDFKAVDENSWDVYFNGLNPAQMRQGVVVTMYKDGQPVSKSMTYSIETYIARMVEKSENELLKTMLVEMLHYGDAAEAALENETETPTTGWETVHYIDFEVDSLEECNCNTAQGTAAVGVLATDVGYNSTKSLQVESGARPKFAPSGNLSAGWYRISGYVKLNGADSSKVSIMPWIRDPENEDGTVTNSTPTKTMSDYIIGFEDENGWSYFEVDIYHGALSLNHQVVFNNYSDVTVYFDDFKYEKYLGEGQPESTPAPLWKNLIEIDFESEMTVTEKVATVTVVDDGTRANSTKVLSMTKSARAQYSVAATLTAGYYRLSGYVKLDDAVAENVSATIWAYKNTDTANTITPTIANSIIGEANATGWSYFEMDVYYGEAYGLLQFIVNNYSTATVLFDDLVYAQYMGEGAPVATAPEDVVNEADVWNELSELDFETEVTLTAKTGTHEVIADSTRENSTKALRVDASSRVQYSEAMDMPLGWYRLSGYVKLGDADPTKVSATIWAYKNSTNGENTLTTTLADSIVGQPDENGWSYFEMDFDHTTKYTALQFILNNYDTTNAVVFDDLICAQYIAEGVPPATEPEESEPEDPIPEETVPEETIPEETVPEETVPEETEPVTLWENVADVDFEVDTLEECNCNTAQGTAAAGVLATDVGYNSTNSLQVESGARPKYYVAGTIAAGWYRISGYVKLNGADPAKVYIRPWVKALNESNELYNDTSTKTMSEYIVGFEDENGWSYFEVDIYHAGSQNNYQVIFENASGVTVYYDDFKYERYLGEGQPEATPAPLWQDLVDIDFETDSLEENDISEHTATVSLAEDTGYDSTKSLQIDNGGRAKYNTADVTLTAGWYCISGYVKLNGAAQSKITLSNWEMQETGSNAVSNYSFADCIMDEADENGWSYFEIFTQQVGTPTVFQFIINNNNGSGVTVYFDNIKYTKYHGEGAPEMPQWKDLFTADFEDGVVPATATDDTFVNTDVTIVDDGRNGGSAVQVGALSRAKFSQSATLPNGYYKLSGYVKLGDVDASKASFVIWARANSVNGTNLIKPVLTNCNIGETVDGWTYFEVIFDHTENYTLIQFFLANGDDTTPIYFDDVVYSRYLGDETLEVTPA